MRKYLKVIANITVMVLLIAVLSFINISTSEDSKLQGGQVPLPILLYHSVNDTPVGLPELTVSSESFEQQMKYLSDNGYTPIYFNEIKNCAKVEKPILITFDDGYSDNFTCAYPILKKYNCKATVFMIANKIGRNGFLSKEQLQSMGDLVSIQSHTVNHKRLDLLSFAKAKYECEESKKILSDITKKPVYVLSYPQGKYNAQVSIMASENYDYAVSTQRGMNTNLSNKYKLKRVSITDMDTLSVFISKITQNAEYKNKKTG